MPRGGKRPNSGPKKGSQHAATLTKEQARAALCRIVLADMRELVGAQLANAKGLKYLVTRDKKTGKFLRVTETMAKAGKDEEIIEVWEKDPSIHAFTDLMNRALDKPKEQEMEIRVSGALEVVSARLKDARKRLAGR